MSLNDIVLLLTFKELSEDDYPRTEADEKLSLFFTGLFLFLGIGIVLYLILVRLGIPENQLQIVILAFFAPYFWDYYINFTVYDVSQLQHVGAALLSMVVCYLLVYVTMLVKEGSQKLSNHKYSLLRSFSFYIFMLMNVLQFLTLTAFAVNFFKFGIHSLISFFIWLL